MSSVPIPVKSEVQRSDRFKRAKQGEYDEVLAPFTAQQMTDIVQMKRAMEWAEGDPPIMAALDSGVLTSEQRARLRAIGVTFDFEALALFWQQPKLMQEVAGAIKAASIEALEELPDAALRALKQFPLIELWMRYILHRNHVLRIHNRESRTYRSRSIAFDGWRQRRIESVLSELGFYGYNIDHAVVSIELAVGCSVGCYFCAYDAPQLTRVFDYTVAENRALFRGVSQALFDELGAMAGHGMLYWSTEPHDNPHYLEFVKEYEEITGRGVFTATARCDEAWIRSLIEYYRHFPSPSPRISVLSKGMLRRIHDRFTPDELRDVPLLMQLKEAGRQKVLGGRPKMMEQLDQASDLRDRDKHQMTDGGVNQGSIACVTGFLINLLDKTVKLVSPCNTTRRYPYGYRVFDQANFETATEFRCVLKAMIERNMRSAPLPDHLIRFRDDLQYRSMGNGFHLVAPNQRHRFDEDAMYAPLGRLIAEGRRTYDQLFDCLVGEHKLNLLMLHQAIKKLFDGGFLDEVYRSTPADHAAVPVDAG